MRIYTCTPVAFGGGGDLESELLHRRLSFGAYGLA